MSKHRRRSYRDFADMSGFEIELPSSPDPLGDEAPPDSARAPPSTTRRLLQSTASSRFSALPGTSPRKRMFALDVGNEITPQTIFVTVEAGQEGNLVTKAPAVGSSVRRRLFGSPTPQPSPQRRVRTTTTTVPLRGLTDDEAGPTPRRGRRSSTGRPGTPGAVSAKKKKRGTPTPKATKSSPKKSRATPAPSSDVDILQSETPLLTPRRRGRPPKRKSPTDPTEQNNPNETQTLPRKRGRRRREALGPDDMDDNPLNEKNTEEAPQSNDVCLKNTNGSAQSKSDDALEAGWVAGQAEYGRDLWMDNMSDPPVVNEPQQTEAGGGATDSSEPVEALHSNRAAPELEDQGALPGESDDYAPMMDYDDRSDVESRHSDPLPDAERNPDELEDQGPLPGELEDYAPMMEQIVDHNDRSEVQSHRSAQPAGLREELDHTVDPESFTMIGIESMPSFRANRNEATSDPAEIGEGTSLFINKTLDSLRQEIAESDEDEVDILVSRGHTPADSDPEVSAPRPPSPPSKRRVSQSSVNRFPRNSPRSPGRIESVAGSVDHPEPYDHGMSPAHLVQSSGTSSPRSITGNFIADEDSFSDIPGDVLAAAESQEWHCELGPNQEAAWTASFNQDFDHSHGFADDQHRGRPQSSHATPSQANLSLKDDENAEPSQRSASRSAQNRRVSNQTMERESPPHSLRSRTDSNRLLTPDATTSSSTQSPRAEQTVADENRTASEDVGSSPPEITSFVEEAEENVLPSRRNSDTPANKHLEGHGEQAQLRHTFAAVLQPSQLGGPRPTLSPVVRIGRTLQNILSDPPSPSGASSVLGSPFKGSVRTSSPMDGAAVDEDLQNGSSSGNVRQTASADSAPHPAEAPAQSPKKSWAMSLAPLSQIRNLVTQGTSLFTSPQVSVAQDIEDPFGPSSPTLDKTLDNTRNSAFMDRIKQASREGSRPSSRTSVRASNYDDIETHLGDKQSFTRRADVVGLDRTSVSLFNEMAALQHTQRHRAKTAVGYDGAYDEDADELADDQPMEALEQQKEDARSLQKDVQQELNNVDQDAQDNAIEVQERDIRDEESSTSPTQHQNQDKADGNVVEVEVRHQRGEHSSTLTIQHQELEDMEANEDMTQLINTLADEEEDEDIWAIEADRTASSPQFTASQHDTSNLFRKSELSIDWGTQSTNSQGFARQTRSPAFTSRRSIRDLPPEDLEDYSLVDLHSGTSVQQSAKKPTPESRTTSKKVDLSDFFSSSPNFIERQRRAKEASLAKSAAQTAVNTSGQVSYPDLTAHNKNAVPPPSQGASGQMAELLSPAPGSSQDTLEPTARTSSSATPEQARHRVPGQRMTPRHARNDAALFETWSVSSKAPTERPPTSEASDTPRSVTPLVRDSSSFETPDLRALPARAASPSKSCLRSPLKPKTPGRVVEFTSSTMSQAAPLQGRADSQNKASATSVSKFELPGSSFPGKENQTTLPKSVFLYTSPQRMQIQQAKQPEQVVDSPLSRTRWSRQHWLFLEELWQEYQHSPLEFQLRHSKAVMASPRQRPSSNLLGKVVTSQGESLELHQAHLDVVDAFKKEVGGWQEEVLAKRLFALIVGTERRRLGLVPKRR
ncbi:hypothetical protein N0V82_001882 [Gnomoniopsis sp. IMI 355080]|nr:hypothetical protein N0V82_001882 [Gnomoniopsis sp. IMI 355080]